MSVRFYSTSSDCPGETDAVSINGFRIVDAPSDQQYLVFNDELKSLVWTDPQSGIS